MFGRLVKKELSHYLFDFRFIVVFALCTLLSVLSAYVGTQNYIRQLQQYNVVSEKSRRTIQISLEKNRLQDLEWTGYRWNKRPESLSPVVYGLSGTLGQEVRIQYRRHLQFEASLFATDPIHALLGILDLAFIVKIVLSLCMLLLTYDAICGEKETGTLRLYASFPVSRSKLALAKLIGSSIAVLTPFVFSFLSASLVLILSSRLNLQGQDWIRIAILAVLSSLYLAVFAGFGIWASALTHKRITSFFGLLGLWTVWIFIIPNMAVDIANHLIPVESVYELERKYSALREEIRESRQREVDDYRRLAPTRNLDALSPEEQQKAQIGLRRIDTKWDMLFYRRLNNIRLEWQNQMSRQQQLTFMLSAISPFSAVSIASMDVARTSFVQQEKLEDALNTYLIYMAQFIQKKKSQAANQRILTDFSLFTYQDDDRLGECLYRNTFHIVNLWLLLILGFTGAYVTILRYDVR